MCGGDDGSGGGGGGFADGDIDDDMVCNKTIFQLSYSLHVNNLNSDPHLYFIHSLVAYPFQLFINYISTNIAARMCCCRMNASRTE